MIVKIWIVSCKHPVLQDILLYRSNIEERISSSAHCLTPADIDVHINPCARLALAQYQLAL